MAESLHQGLAQWIQCKLGKQYLWKKVTLPWESNPGPTPIRGDPATLVASVGLKKLEFNISSKENSMIARIIACQEHRMQCSQFFRRANFCKKTGAILAKIRAKRRAKLKFFVILSSFCDLNHQQFSEINGSLWGGTLHRACTLINCPKQHNNTLNVSKIANRRAKSQKYGH